MEPNSETKARVVWYRPGTREVDTERSEPLPPPKEPCAGGVPILISGPQPPQERASVFTKAQRLRVELTEWAKAGAPVASRETRKARTAVCNACAYWRPTGNWGLGECQYPGCGCTRAKRYLSTAKCPAGKWPA